MGPNVDRRRRALPALFAILMAAAPAARAVEGPPAADPAVLLERLERLEALNQRVLDQNEALQADNAQLRERVDDLTRRQEAIDGRLAAPPLPDVAPEAATAPLFGPPAPVAPTFSEFSATPDAEPDPAPLSRTSLTGLPDRSRFLMGDFDPERGFLIVRPSDRQRTPFELRADLSTQLRYTGFARSAETWTDSSGALRPIRNISDFEINRGWIEFNGFALDPRLQFRTAIFTSTATNNAIFLGYLTYAFSDAVQLSAGYWKVPGSREWYDSYRVTLGADRTMATTFFRPSFSPGFWFSGEPVKNLRYVAMMGNTLSGDSLNANRIGANPSFAASTWWEPAGPFGPGPSDLEWHERPTPRIGTSYAWAREANQGISTIPNNPEDTRLRLSDGTLFFSENALGPGSEVLFTNHSLWSVDAALKYRGLSVGAEAYARLLNNFQSIGMPQRSSLFDKGLLVQGGYFLVPRKLEAFARTSLVTGPFGSGHEVSGGVNYYVLGTYNWRWTFDVTRVESSPAQNILTGYRAGESGTLFQLQMLADF
jgi:hypothetical protein